MTWQPVSSQALGFLVLSLLLYGDHIHAYGGDDHTYGYAIHAEGDAATAPGEWYPAASESGDWVNGVPAS